MKIQRNKKFKKRLEFYKNNFGFKSPFHMLVDGTFCFAALENKVNIREQLSKLFEDNLKLLTTPCVVTEMQNMGPSVYGAFLIVKQFEHFQCGHDVNSTGAVQCILKLIKRNNKHRFCVATQDSDLRSRLLARAVSAPILYLHGAAPTLLRPADGVGVIKRNTTLSRQQKLDVAEMKQRLLPTDEANMKRRAPKKKTKGANPLSCKRKRSCVDKSDESGAVKTTKRRRKKRVRVSKHVLQELASRDIAH